MSRSEDDEIAAVISAQNEREVAADARQFTGPEVRLLRAAIDSGATALARINIKGLPRAHRGDVEMARTALAGAARLLAPSAPRPAAIPDTAQSPAGSAAGGEAAG